MKILLIYLNTILILAALLPARSLKAQITDITRITDIIHYWKFDETGGVIFEDSEGNLDMTCAAPGCPAPVAGQVNGALNFDGVDDKLITDPAQIPNQSNGITVMAWINPDNIDSANKGIVYKMGCLLLEVDSQTGFIYWSVRVGFGLNEFQPAGNIPLNAWTHLAATYDGTELKVYKNGELAASQAAAYPGAIDNPFTPYQIGNSKFDNDRYFEGSIDEVAIFNRALTHSEIQWAYEMGLDGSPLLMISNSSFANTFQLHPNFPNPFNPGTTLRFEIPASVTIRTAVELAIFNSQGQHIKTLYRGSILPGTHELNWNGDTDSGRAVASGMYYAVLKMNNLVQTRKLLLVK